MHSTAFIVALFAASAMAGPYHNRHAELHKRRPVEVVETVTTVDWTYDTVTVTAGQPHTASSSASVKAEAENVEYQPKKEEYHHYNTYTSSAAPVYSAPPVSTYPTTTDAPSSTYVAPSPTAESSSAAAPVPSSDTTDSSDGSYQGTILSSHQKYRANFGHGALVWNDTLASLAKYEAEAANCQMAHNLNDENGSPVAMGQNLAMGTDADGPKGDWSQVAGQVGDWYNEWPSYGSCSQNFESPPTQQAMSTGTNNGTEILHFSQLVWKATEQVGCYTKTGCPSGNPNEAVQSLTFCNYYPAGNIADENDSNPYQSYLENVGQPVSSSY